MPRFFKYLYPTLVTAILMARKAGRAIMKIIPIILAVVPLCISGRVQASSVLYVTEVYSQTLSTLSLSDASPTLVGHFNFSGNNGGNAVMADLAYDPNDDILYGTTTVTDNLYSIDRNTGVATLIGPLDATLMHGLAFDWVTGTLYGASTV